MAAMSRKEANDWLTDAGMKKYMTEASTGKFDDGKEDASFKNAYKDYMATAKVIGLDVTSKGSEIHSQYGQSKEEVGNINREIAPDERKITEINDKIRNAEASARIRIEGDIPDDVYVYPDGTISYEDAKAIVERANKENEKEKQRRKVNRDAARDGRFGGSK